MDMWRASMLVAFANYSHYSSARRNHAVGDGSCWGWGCDTSQQSVTGGNERGTSITEGNRMRFSSNTNNKLLVEFICSRDVLLGAMTRGIGRRSSSSSSCLIKYYYILVVMVEKWDYGLLSWKVSVLNSSQSLPLTLHHHCSVTYKLFSIFSVNDI